jgi:hypothetical protein
MYIITLYTHTTYLHTHTRCSAPFQLVTSVRFAKLHGALVALPFSESNWSTAVDEPLNHLPEQSKKNSREKTTCLDTRQQASTSLCIREQPSRTSLPSLRYDSPPLTSINTPRPNFSTNSHATYHFCRAPDKTRPPHYDDVIRLNTEPHHFNITRYPAVNEAKPQCKLFI